MKLKDFRREVKAGFVAVTWAREAACRSLLCRSKRRNLTCPRTCARPQLIILQKGGCAEDVLCTARKTSQQGLNVHALFVRLTFVWEKTKTVFKGFTNKFCLCGSVAYYLQHLWKSKQRKTFQQINFFYIPYTHQNARHLSSSYTCHGVGPLVDPFRSHVSRSLFKGLL